MSYNDCTLEILDLQDPNIYFDAEFCKEEVIKGIKSKVFQAKLKLKPDSCYCCDTPFDNKITIHGYKPSLIKLPCVSKFCSYLRLFKQRYKCEHCGHTFTVKTPIVEKNCFISNNTKKSAAMDATKKLSMKDIAGENNISITTVSRVFDQYYDGRVINFNYLPTALCFDEFKSTKSATNKMSFIFIDGDTFKICDIVENRQLHSLEKYFSNYSKTARLGVKNIVIDMYAPYISLIKKCFPNALITFDRFHIVQLISRATTKSRIELMKNNKPNYNKLKRYWKLLLKDRRELDLVNYRKFYCYKKFMCEADIVDDILKIDEIFKNTYEIYQQLLMSIREKDVDELERLINQKHENVSSHMNTSLKTLKKYSQYVINGVKSKYSNGPIEGTNNKIKVIKRIAFGYKSFLNFKRRILILFNLISPCKKA